MSERSPSRHSREGGNPEMPAKTSNPPDWMDEVDDIKRRLAERYKDISPSEQVRLMRESVEKEWKRRGWELKRKSERSKGTPDNR